MSALRDGDRVRFSAQYLANCRPYATAAWMATESARLGYIVAIQRCGDVVVCWDGWNGPCVHPAERVEAVT